VIPRALRAAARDDLEIADVIHGAAFFNWANRLMLSLGVPWRRPGPDRPQPIPVDRVAVGTYHEHRLISPGDRRWFEIRSSRSGVAPAFRLQIQGGWRA
jgi:hypothetical protein